ncbi:UDP-glucuronosyltransferase 2C1-like [Megalops cyprinoides]|uniref:UDP-glucuronosyltransferase 2C1-like n=1 Tax=Megalops cyprinoides TaxID=118141 RepID=UPI0018645F63|nr:UDP-glucuronosyltransferase 2C1-like [Megalops cyprinoides]
MVKPDILLPICHFLVLFTLFGVVDAGKVLAVPVGGSHWSTMKFLIKDLTKKGHEVTVIRLSHDLNVDSTSPDFKVITIQLSDNQARSMEEKIETVLSWIFYNTFMKETSSSTAFWEFLMSVRRLTQDNKLAIETIFDNTSLVRQLQETHFDIALADPFFPGSLMLARYLNLPIVLFGKWMPTEDIHFHIAPSPLSYVPVLNSRLTDRMTFLQRLKNVLMYSFGRLLNHIFIYSTYNELCKRYLKSADSIYTLYKQADIYLMKSDFALEFVRPCMPNTIYIGGFHIQPANPLPPELQEFMDEAESGVVIFSLGSIFSTLPGNIATEIAAGLAQLPQRVVWRYTGPPIPGLGNNTKLVSWLPQNDLLGHPNTKAFIAHGGENGIYEAIYHGVPVVGFPLFGDNYDNLLRLRVKGAAILLENLNRLNRRDIWAAVQNVTEDPSYRISMRKLSQLHRDTPIPGRKLAVFWTEYVMRNKGAHHLRVAGNDLPFYQYHLLDVLAFILMCLVLLSYSAWSVLRILWRTLHGRIKVKKL